MSETNGNGVIRVGRKGRKKFAFGEEGAPFEVDVVVAFQEWIAIDEDIRDRYEDRIIPVAAMPHYHQSAVEFAKRMATDPTAMHDVPDISTAEALDFIARLREQYDEVAAFFQPKSRDERVSPDSSDMELRFSEEPLPN